MLNPSPLTPSVTSSITTYNTEYQPVAQKGDGSDGYFLGKILGGNLEQRVMLTQGNKKTLGHRNVTPQGFVQLS